MLEILGTIGSNILSLPGILGFGLGMMTRNIVLGAILGALAGVLEVLAFAGFSTSAIYGGEAIASLAIGLLAGALGSMFRRRGATV